MEGWGAMERREVCKGKVVGWTINAQYKHLVLKIVPLLDRLAHVLPPEMNWKVSY